MRWPRMKASVIQVNVHQQILDTATEALHRRFLIHGTLSADLSPLHPKNFHLIHTSALPESALAELSKCLVVYDSTATVANLQTEVRNWDRLVQSPALNESS